MQFVKKDKSGIGRKIAKLVAYSVFAAMIILALLLSIMQVKETFETKRAGLEATAFVFASAIADHVEARNSGEIQRVLRSVARVPAILNAAALDKTGATIAQMGNATFLRSDLIDDKQSTLAMLTKGFLPITVDIKRGGEIVGSLVMFADISDVRFHLFWNLFTTFLASLVAAGFAVQISVPLQHKITAPLVALTTAITKVRDTRSFEVANIDGAQGETRVLVESFNGMIDDIRTRDQAMQKLAYFDPLTGLPNRVHFQKIVDELFNNPNGPQSAALFVADIDNFHAINDAMGHSIGDAMLMNLAALFKDEAGETAQIARLGGDEFAICVPNISTIAEAELQLARFIATLYQPVKLLGQELHITVAVGAIVVPLQATNSSEAQRFLNLALHEAKNLGPGRVCFFRQELADNIKAEAELAQGLRLALSNNELQVHYQPVVDLKTKLVTGFEALARWKHPTKGFISPARFIPVAEKSGMISELGDWILLESCKQAKAWIDAGQSPRTVAVNISAAQIIQSGFMGKVRAALSESGLPANLLCLELTESLFVGKSMTTVEKMLYQLREIGVCTALDDFGTGYSSLSYLENLPFDKLKIDRAFVSGMKGGRKSIDLMKGIINLAHALGMSVVAEGAESADEVRTLRELDADSVQGYIYAKPAPAEQALEIANQIDSQAGYKSVANLR